MFMNTVLASVAALLCASLNIVDARYVKRDVISPPITYPTNGTVWDVGQRHNVTWDTSVIPPGFTSNGMIVLGFLDDSGDGNEHLDLNNPLAQGFPITDGRAEITVPSVQTRNTYILVLFGDSGNASGKFTIQNISIGAPSSTSVPSTVAPIETSTTESSTGAPGTSETSSETASSAVPSASSAANPAPAPAPVASSPAAAASNPAASTPVATPSTPSTPLKAESTPSNAAKSTVPAIAPSVVANNNQNAGVRSVSTGTWLSTACSVGIVLALAL